MILLMCRDRSITIGLPDRLAGQAGPGAAGQDRNAELAGGGHDGGHVIGVTGKHHPDRLDRVHARVAGEQVPAVGVEPDLAADDAAQRRRDFRALARLASLTCPCRAGAGRLTADALHLLRSPPRAA